MMNFPNKIHHFIPDNVKYFIPNNLLIIQVQINIHLSFIFQFILLSLTNYLSLKYYYFVLFYSQQSSRTSFGLKIE